MEWQHHYRRCLLESARNDGLILVKDETRLKEFVHLLHKNVAWLWGAFSIFKKHSEQLFRGKG
jgi:hypothetical protein